jgi:hypothetical protein
MKFSESVFLLKLIKIDNMNKNRDKEYKNITKVRN